MEDNNNTINNNNNNDDQKHSEEFCTMCRRGSSIAGNMFHLPGGINMCADCMRKSLDQMNNLGMGDMIGGNIPGMQFTVSKEEVKPVKKVTGGMPDGSNIDERTGEEKKTEEDPEKTDKTDDSKEESNQQGGIFGIPGIQFLNWGDMGMGARKRQVKSDPEALKRQFDLQNIPKPHKLKEMLDEYVIGQDAAKKVISVAVYNHYKRVHADLTDSNDTEIGKSNILMIGPTGCGKTYLVQTLARLLNVPLAIADATSLTEAGYIGDDIESVVSKLLAAADNDVEKAECGIIFVDEIDKLARKKNATTRDVSGESVQQGMLKLLEGSEVEVPVGAGSKNAMVPMAKVNTKNILFICGGAFPDLDDVIKQRLRKETSIGFDAELKDKWDKEKSILSKVTVEDIKKFGMIPEFVGRMPIICTLEGLTEDALVKILKEPKNAIIRQYTSLLAMDEVKLTFEDDALKEIAKKALEKETGARGLRAVIEEYMLDIMYEVPKDENIGEVIITKDFVEGKGSPEIKMREFVVPGIDNTRTYLIK
ncbi:MAG: ATP-dependent Clp protease ATP-binding subunit ClpX [Lachnospiraceae bacterium]|nr:ATP-dependent Clp protease ATP-binding subunit ClpX [Lachnospiraceae bacterium]